MNWNCAAQQLTKEMQHIELKANVEKISRNAIFLLCFNYPKTHICIAFPTNMFNEMQFSSQNIRLNQTDWCHVRCGCCIELVKCFLWKHSFCGGVFFFKKICITYNVYNVPKCSIPVLFFIMQTHHVFVNIHHSIEKTPTAL